MKCQHILVFVLSILSVASAGETLFTSGPQEFAGQKYYWLAEWKLEVTLSGDTTSDDQFEVLFGSKGVGKRTLYFEYDGKSGSMSNVGQEGYSWVQIRLGELSGGKKVILYGKGREQVAFLAGVRIRGKSILAPEVKPIRTTATPPSGQHSAQWADLAGFELTDEARRLWNPSPGQPDWRRAERSARYAGIALTKVQRWLHEQCLSVHDKRSGLFRPTGREWNYRDTAADCYPFYVWAAYYTDKEILDTVMIDTLKAEQWLCNHLDRLPVRYDMDTRQKITTSFDAMVFGACEYAKDGLTPIVEITGKEYPWFDRMRGLVDDIFKHARTDTPYGRIPSTNIEVNGELLQLLPRLYSMTEEREYLDWAHRLADYYLLPGKFVPSRLSDHGCEIIGGLGLLFAVDTTASPEKAEQYKPHMQYMFDEILRRGTNSDGIIIRNLQDAAGPHDGVTTGDGWGYDYVGFLDYDLASGTQHYREAIRRPMTNLLKPRYKRFNWDHGSRDNVADSVEGGLYLLYRIPVTEAFVWADREMATLLVDHSDADRLWGVHKLEANTVRTVLIHTMLHTRNTIARPWRQGLQLGAAPFRGGICIYMKSDKLYEGQLQFDIPRHRLYMGFEQDWPRMNAVPEWFTVEPDESHMYRVEDIGAGRTKVVSGKLLSEGLPVRIEPSKPLRLTVSLRDGKAGDILLMTTPSYAQQVDDPEPERFAKSMAAFAQQDSESPFDKGGIVFVGSSSVRVLDIPKYFPGLKALNRGFGGAHISDVNYYIEETVLKYEPSKVIFFCGGNDLWAGKSVQQVKEDFDNFRKCLFERAPDAELIVLGIRPSPRRIAIIDKELKMNAVINNVAGDDKRITYLNGSCDRFLDANGQPIIGLYADDRLHMNDAGYRIWVEILEPFLP